MKKNYFVIVLLASFVFCFTAFAGTPPHNFDSISTWTYGSNLWLSHGATCVVGDSVYAYYCMYYSVGNGSGLMKTSRLDTGAIWKDYGSLHVGSKTTLVGDSGTFDSWWASFPGIWYENGVYHLVYEAVQGNSSQQTWTGIGYAFSTDGIHFSKPYNGPILKPDTLSYQYIAMGTPKLYHLNGIWYLFYHGDGKTPFNYWTDSDPSALWKTDQICLATGTSLEPGKLMPVTNNPILPVIPNTWEAHSTGSRNIYYVNGLFYMVYEACYDSAFDNHSQHLQVAFQDATWGWGLATSHDLVHWRRCSTPITGTMINPFDAFHATYNWIPWESKYGWFTHQDGVMFVPLQNGLNVFRRGNAEIPSNPNPMVVKTLIDPTIYNLNFEAESLYHKYGYQTMHGETTCWAVDTTTNDSCGVWLWGPKIRPCNVRDGEHVATYVLKAIKKPTISGDSLFKFDICSGHGVKILAEKKFNIASNDTMWQYINLPYIKTSTDSVIEYRLHLLKANGTNSKYEVYADRVTSTDKFFYTFQAESLLHNVGRRDTLNNIIGWRAGKDTSGALCYGPFTQTIPVGKNIAVYKVTIDTTLLTYWDRVNNVDVGYIDVVTGYYGAMSLASKTLKVRDFTGSNQYQLITLSFNNPAYTAPDPNKDSSLQFRIFSYGKTRFRADKVFIYYEN